jgi:hypothetical protein
MSSKLRPTIKYVYTDSQHKNPLCRIAPIDSSNKIKGKLDYDKEKYKEMILDAAGTVLGYFGFDRTVYGIVIVFFLDFFSLTS